jgi:hypothetical protein
MSKAELLAQIDAMTEEEAAEVRLIYAPDWPDKATVFEEVRKRRAALLETPTPLLTCARWQGAAIFAPAYGH